MGGMDYQQITAHFTQKKNRLPDTSYYLYNMLMMTIDTGTVAKSSRYEKFLPYRGIPMPGVTTVVERKGR